VEIEVRELLTKYEFPGDRFVIIGSAKLALEGDRAIWASRASIGWPRRWTAIIPQAEAVDRWAVSDAGGRRVLDLGSGRCDRAGGPRGGEVGEELEIVGLKPTLKTVCTGVEISASSWIGAGGGQHRVLLRGTSARRWSAAGVAKPGRITPHTSSAARCMCCRRRKAGAHAVFPGYRPQFYFRDHGRDGSVELPAGTEDGDAWGQHSDDG